MTSQTYLTRREAADLLRCSTDTIDRRIADGSLTTTRFGRKVLIESRSIGQLLASRVKDVRS